MIVSIECFIEKRRPWGMQSDLGLRSPHSPESISMSHCTTQIQAEIKQHDYTGWLGIFYLVAAQKQIVFDPLLYQMSVSLTNTQTAAIKLSSDFSKRIKCTCTASAIFVWFKFYIYGEDIYTLSSLVLPFIIGVRASSRAGSKTPTLFERVIARSSPRGLIIKTSFCNRTILGCKLTYTSKL